MNFKDVPESEMMSGNFSDETINSILISRKETYEYNLSAFFDSFFETNIHYFFGGFFISYFAVTLYLHGTVDTEQLPERVIVLLFTLWVGYGFSRFFTLLSAKPSAKTVLDQLKSYRAYQLRKESLVKSRLK